MGIESVVSGLFGLAGAGISAFSAHHTQAANAAAQSQLNKETMKFNKKEAAKSRKWQAEQADIDRQFNAAQQVEAQKFNAEQAANAMEFATGESAIGRQFNAEQSMLARQFEERMSSSAHQREVQDLKAAGLNPILSGTGGAGSASPVAPILSSPVASGSMAQSSAIGHSGGSAPAAHIGALNAYMKKDVLGQFVSSALESIRVNNDYIKAKAQDKEADAAARNALTNAKRQIVDSFTSMAEVTKIKSEVNLNKWRSLSEEKQVNLFKEKIISEIRERTDKHNLSEAQQQAVMISANAAATAASAQAHMADIQDRIQSAESPERINKLQKEAKYWQSEFDKNKWIMDDPKIILERKWWKDNEGAVGVKQAADIIGEVFRGGMILPIK